MRLLFVGIAVVYSGAAMPTPTSAAKKPEGPSRVSCGVVVAGGSTASLAAAITAAAAAPSVTVCLSDPTDWPGGQLTASAVSALDFGTNRNRTFQSRTFRELMAALGAPANPGACWVSTMCYEPTTLLRRWIEPALGALPNLRVLTRTVITGTVPCAGAARRICALTAVQRTARPGSKAEAWGRLLSETLADWYHPTPSPDFAKTSLVLTGDVFVDATEFGDVLVTGAATELGLPVAQGVEAGPLHGIHRPFQ